MWMRRSAPHSPPEPTRHEFDALPSTLDPPPKNARADASGHVVQFQRRQVLRQAQIDLIEREVGRQLVQATVGKTHPGAHGAPAMRQGDRVVEPGAPDGQIGVVDLGEDLPVPRSGLREHPCRENRRADRSSKPVRLAARPSGRNDAVARRCRGRNSRLRESAAAPRAMRPPRPASRRGCGCALRQHPVRHTAVTALLRDRNAGDVKTAVGVAPQMQGRRGNSQQSAGAVADAAAMTTRGRSRRARKPAPAALPHRQCAHRSRVRSGLIPSQLASIGPMTDRSARAPWLTRRSMSGR